MRNELDVNDDILKNVINIHRDSPYWRWPVNGEPSNTFRTLELIFSISKKVCFCLVPKSIVLFMFQNASFLIRSKKDHSCYVPKRFVLFCSKKDCSCYVPKSIILVSLQKWLFLFCCKKHRSCFVSKSICSWHPCGMFSIGFVHIQHIT